jgi:hypothetical protein
MQATATPANGRACKCPCRDISLSNCFVFHCFSKIQWLASKASTVGTWMTSKV